MGIPAFGPNIGAFCEWLIEEGCTCPSKPTDLQVKGFPRPDPIMMRIMLNNGILVEVSPGLYYVDVPVFREWQSRGRDMSWTEVAIVLLVVLLAPNVFWAKQTQ